MVYCVCVNVYVYGVLHMCKCIGVWCVVCVNVYVYGVLHMCKCMCVVYCVCVNVYVCGVLCMCIWYTVWDYMRMVYSV